MYSKPVMSHTVAPGRTLKISATPGVSTYLSGLATAPIPPAATALPFPASHVPHHDIQFNVVVRGQVFKLNYDQIMYDQPNIFTSAFFDGFSESDSRTITIHGRSPALFAVIYEYLSGYAILPNPDIDLRNLLSDCEYYGLQRLKDELTLPKLNDAPSTRHEVGRVVRFEDVASRQASAIEWTEHGLIDANDPSKHLLVFITKVHFKLDLTVKANGECPLVAFAIELPSYAKKGLSTKPLRLEGEEQVDWTAVTIEALSSTPFTLNDGEFEGNFGDLVHWVGSFMTRHSSTSSTTGASNRSIFGSNDPAVIDQLTKTMPGLADTLRLRAYQGQTTLELSTAFWASEMSVIIAPPDSFEPASTSHTDSHPDPNHLVAKILNCHLSTGLHRRKHIKALVNL